MQASTGEGADRTSIDLAGVQLDLVDAVLGTGTPTVIVLSHGRPASFGEDAGGAVTSKFGTAPMYLRAEALVAAFRPGTHQQLVLTCSNMRDHHLRDKRLGLQIN